MGKHAPGDRLPAERELSTQLGVSRLTLRSALARLQSEGLVRAVHGSGNIVEDFRHTGGIDLLGHLAQLAMRGETVSSKILADVLELRRAIAVEALGLATERASEEHLRGLQRALDHQRSVMDRPVEFMQADLEFARCVTRATENIAYELVLNTVQRIIAENPVLVMVYFTNAEQTVVVYARIIELMRKGDAARVRQMTNRILDRLDRRTLQLLDSPALG